MTSLDQMLSYAGGKIAHMSDEFLKHKDKLPFEDIKTMTKELKKTKQNLSQVLGRDDIPKFDKKLISSILSYIDKIKKTAPQEQAADKRNKTKKSTPQEAAAGKRRSQKVIFLDELVELQGVLKILRSKSKSPSTSSIKRKSIIKIEGFKSKGGGSANQDLGKHLSLTETKLNALKKSTAKKSKVNQTQFKEVITVLKKTNLSLVKAKAMHKSLSGQYNPEYDKKVIRKIFQEIEFFQDLMDDTIRTGTAQMQANLFWFTLKEFHHLLQDLESLKKIRGKQVASVQTDMSH